MKRIIFTVPPTLIIIGLSSCLNLLAEGFSAGSSKKKNASTSTPHNTKQRGRPSKPRPIISIDSFAYLSAHRDGINILPAPDGKGMGTFTTSAIVKGETIGEYTGEVLTKKEVEARYWNLRKENKHDRKWRNSRKRRNQGITGDYLFDIGNDLFIDGEDADVSSWCRFANHADPTIDGSKACNIEVRARKDDTGTSSNDDDKVHLYFIALIDIEKGCELQYDYGEVYWDGDI